MRSIIGVGTSDAKFGSWSMRLIRYASFEVVPEVIKDPADRFRLNAKCFEPRILAFSGDTGYVSPCVMGIHDVTKHGERTCMVDLLETLPNLLMVSSAQM